MRLTNEQRIEIMLIAGSESNRMVAAEFDGKCLFLLCIKTYVQYFLSIFMNRANASVTSFFAKTNEGQSEIEF